jgi:hypothetical protein
MKPTGISTNERQLAWWAKDAVVYFVGAGSPPVSIKIGVTTWGTVRSRLAAIQSANHECIELLGVIPFRGMAQPMKAAEDREREIHLLFRLLQRAKPGQRGQEWFSATPELLEFVKTTARPAAEFGFPTRAR